MISLILSMSMRGTIRFHHIFHRAVKRPGELLDGFRRAAFNVASAGADIHDRCFRHTADFGEMILTHLPLIEKRL